MKNLILSLVLGTSLLGAQVFAKEFEVEMKSISFNPKTIEISAGDSIVWKNISYTDHNAGSETFMTGTVQPKAKSKPIVFAKAGSFPYHCQIHGKTMSGVVNVTEKASGK